MADKDMSKSDEKVEKKEEPAKPAAKGEMIVSKPAAPAPVAPVPAPAPLMTFDRWFATTKRKPHHKAGMYAFANTNGRKTRAQWDAVFKTY